MRRRLLISICGRETGTVVLPVERGGRARRLDAPAIARHLEALVARRGLGGRVRVSDACAGGCALSGPNVTVTIYPAARPGEREDRVAVGWRSYAGALGDLDCLARLIDDNLRG